MEMLTKQLKVMASQAGADLVGIAGRECLADAPPSGDPTCLLPSARSVISFAVALDPQAARAFISKEDWLSHGEDRKSAVKRLYTIGDGLVRFLEENGYEAVNVEINNRYRPEEGAADVTEMTEFYPDFSHRYGAVAAGIGRLGWSGNLMTHRYGALVELGSVLTSAELICDPVLDKNPCDRCKICSMVCPVEMMSSRESVKVKVAGITEEIALKRPNTCCWIGCSGYEGLSTEGKWSNWSPYRLGKPLPEEKSELDALCVRLQKADPQMYMEDNVFSNYRSAVFDPEWFYYTVCGFCRSVCSPTREERFEKRRNLHDSGIAALRSDGMHVVAEGKTVEVQTPFAVKVVVQEEELEQLGEIGSDAVTPAGRWPLDREVLAWLPKRVK
jgi:epoxyqueuosine reductase